MYEYHLFDEANRRLILRFSIYFVGRFTNAI